jgi:phage-related protein
MYQDSFILLHWFYKKTNKTPRHEIDMAIKEMNSYIEEVKNYE